MLLDYSKPMAFEKIKNNIINSICDIFNISIYPNVENVIDVKLLNIMNIYDGDILYRIKVRLKANGAITINNLEDYRNDIEGLVKRPIKFNIIDYKNLHIDVLYFDYERETDISNKVKYQFIPCVGFENVLSGNEVVRYEYIEGEKENIEVCIGYNLDNEKVWFNILNSHSLIGGSARWGKSSFLNVFITSAMLNFTPNEVMFIGCDFKKSDVYYFRNYKHFRGMSVNKKQFLEQVRGLEKEMDKRSLLLDEKNCRNVIKYNKISESKLPYIIFIIDELPQLVNDEECKNVLHLIMAKSASYGVYFILATQDCTKATIGKCKMNCSQTIGFHTRDRTDSETLIGEGYNLQDIQVRGRCKFDNGSDKVVETQIFFLEEEEMEERLKHFKKDNI